MFFDFLKKKAVNSLLRSLMKEKTLKKNWRTYTSQHLSITKFLRSSSDFKEIFGDVFQWHTQKDIHTHTYTHRHSKYSFVIALDFVYQRIYFIFMLWKWRFIYMVRRSHTQLKRRWNSRRLVCMWQYWAKLEEFCSKRHSINAWKTKAMGNYVETLRLTFNTYRR